MEVLLTDEADLPIFLIEFQNHISPFDGNFIVHEVESWNLDNSVADYTKYLMGFIKWDGCSHFWFGNESGYIHLCGKEAIDRHKQVMDKVWEVVTSKIEGFKG